MPVEIPDGDFALRLPARAREAARPPACTVPHTGRASDHPAMRDLLETIARGRSWHTLVRGGLNPDDPRGSWGILARDLAVTFDEAARHGLGGAPWYAMRGFTDWLYREKRSPAAALPYVRLMQEAAARPAVAARLDPDILADIQAVLEADSVSLRRDLDQALLKLNDAHGDEAGAIRAAERLAELSRTPEEREHWMGVRRDRKRWQAFERRAMVWYFGAVAVVCLGLAAVEEGWFSPRQAPRPYAGQAAAPVAMPAAPVATDRRAEARRDASVVIAPEPDQALPARGTRARLTLPELRWCEVQRLRGEGARAQTDVLDGLDDIPWATRERATDRNRALRDERGERCENRPADAADAARIAAELASRAPSLREEGARFLGTPSRAR